MEAVGSSEMKVVIYETPRRHILEAHNLNINRRVKPKSHIIIILFNRTSEGPHLQMVMTLRQVEINGAKV
jgi:hypothetical protein